MDDLEAKYQFHVKLLMEELELLRAENRRLMDATLRSLDQTITVLDRIARNDGGGA
jgi:hypothetical protein